MDINVIRYIYLFSFLAILFCSNVYSNTKTIGFLNDTTEHQNTQLTINNTKVTSSSDISPPLPINVNLSLANTFKQPNLPNITSIPVQDELKKLQLEIDALKALTEKNIKEIEANKNKTDSYKKEVVGNNNLKDQLDIFDKRIHEHTKSIDIILVIIGIVLVVFQTLTGLFSYKTKADLDKMTEDALNTLKEKTSEYSIRFDNLNTELTEMSELLTNLKKLSNSIDEDISTMLAISSDVMNYNFKILEAEKKLAEAGPENKNELFQNYCRAISSEIGRLERGKITLIEHLNEVSKQDLDGLKEHIQSALKREIQRISFLLGLGYRKIKEYREAIETLKIGLQYSNSDKSDSLLKYNIACYLCLTEEIDLATMYLSEAVRGDSSLITHAKNDDDLKSIQRDSNRWDRVLASLHKK